MSNEGNNLCLVNRINRSRQRANEIEAVRQEIGANPIYCAIIGDYFSGRGSGDMELEYALLASGDYNVCLDLLIDYYINGWKNGRAAWRVFEEKLEAFRETPPTADAAVLVKSFSPFPCSSLVREVEIRLVDIETFIVVVDRRQRHDESVAK